MESFKEMLMRHEGYSHKLYKDTVGKYTIGYGRNIEDKGVSADEANLMFENDLAEARNDCLHVFPWFAELDERRQWVLLNMCFNMGLTRLQGFTKFLKAVEAGDYVDAAKEMRQSLWATQVKGRAKELAALMQGSVGT